MISFFMWLKEKNKKKRDINKIFNIKKIFMYHYSHLDISFHQFHCSFYLFSTNLNW